MSLFRSLFSRAPEAAARRAAFLVACNWVTTLTEAAGGFVTAPLLVRGLGVSGYGAWILMSSVAGYFLLLDLGIRSAVGRQIAFHHAKNDGEARGILTAGLVAMVAIGLVIAAVIIGYRDFWLALLAIPINLRNECRLALTLVAVNLALSMLVQIFDGALWAFSRFDLLTLVDAPASILRTTFVAAVVLSGNVTLSLLAEVILLITIAAGACKVFLTLRLSADTVPSVQHLRHWHFRQLLDYGQHNFVLGLARTVKVQSLPMLVSRGLGLSAVTPYSVARRLQDYSHQLIWTTTGTITPMSARRFADSGVAGQREILLVGGRWCWSAALLICVGSIGFARPLLQLWMGSSIGAASFSLLVLLVLGELPAMSQSASGSILLGMSRHKALALLAVAETAVTLPCVILATRTGELAWCGVAIALPQALIGGLFTWLWACHSTNVSPATYTRQVFVGPLLRAIPTILTVITMRATVSYWSWLRLIVCGGLVVGVHFLTSHRYLIPRVTDSGRHGSASIPATAA